MKKYYCDCCGKEITSQNKVQGGNLVSERLGSTVTAKNKKLGSLSAEVITNYNGISNDGDYCKYCVLDALYQLDDRKLERKKISLPPPRQRLRG